MWADIDILRTTSLFSVGSRETYCTSLATLILIQANPYNLEGTAVRLTNERRAGPR